MYYNGRGVAQDYVEAARWYRLAADQGSALSQYALGMMYYYGQGVATDYIEAFKWVKLAATSSDQDVDKVRDLIESDLKRKGQLLLAGLIGLALGYVFLVFMGYDAVKTGTMELRGGIKIKRSENPITFWFTTLFIASVGVFCVVGGLSYWFGWFGR